MFQTQSLVITKKILNSIARIDEFKGLWRGQGPLAPERANHLQQQCIEAAARASLRFDSDLGAGFAQRFDRQEKASLSLAEPDHDSRPTTQPTASAPSFVTREQQSMGGYKAALTMIYRDWQQLRPSGQTMQELHRLLYKFAPQEVHRRGQCRPIDPEEESFSPDEQIARLTHWYEEEEGLDTLHPLIRIAMFQTLFLAIRPFPMGNQRLSFLLIDLMLLRSGYIYAQFAALESSFAAKAGSILNTLAATQAEVWGKCPHWNPWVSCFLSCLVEHTHRLEKAMDGGQVKTEHLPQLSAEILSLAQSEGRVTVAKALSATAAKRSTLKDHFKTLVQKGYLERHGAGRGVWYHAV